MMSNILLSICIPTYNRSKFLKTCLEGFVGQILEDGLTGSVEIVISDNCSPDDTGDTVSAFKRQFHNITYSRNEQNLGVDRNVAKAISLARGEYIWFFSDDDWIADGAVANIVGRLKPGAPGAMIVNWLNYYPGGQVTAKDLKFDTDKVFGSLSELLGTVNSTFFLSSLMFKRELLNHELASSYFSPPGFFHWGAFLNAAANSSSCGVIADPLICHRVGNESYLRQWPEIFLNIMPDFFMKCAAELGISQKAIDYQLNNYLTKVSLMTIMQVRVLFNRSHAELKDVLRNSSAYYGSYFKYYLYIVPPFYIPTPVLKGMLFLYRYFKRTDPEITIP
jgi:glycosyltransferase involved in cell wall biosynthesis